MSSSHQSRRFRRWSIQILGLVALLLCGALAIWFTSPTAPPQPRTSNYAISIQAPFNQPDHYPIRHTLPADLYRPTGDWVGRLILPTVDEIRVVSEEQGSIDWVWFEVLHAPDPEWLGETLRLQWGESAFARTYPDVVTVKVRLGDAAQQSQLKGDVVPTRLDGWNRVGPLQSLAGSRPLNDVIVALSQTTARLDEEAETPVLFTDLEPVLVTGRYVALVQILEPLPDDPDTDTELCPSAPCSSEYFRVRHYDRNSGGFEGPEEIVRIPQTPPDRNQVFPSTPTGIEDSPAGEDGWYLYGAQDRTGIFTVQALQPRSLVRLQPEQVILGSRAGLNYITQGNWQDTPARKGTVSSVLIAPIAETEAAALSSWQEGDFGLLIHLFGGIGGDKAESTLAGLVQGHLSFGLAEVVRDPFTDDLVFDILYQQVYAHNPHAIIAGTHAWPDFTGDLQRGWLGTRPISDVIVKLDLFTQDYVFETGGGEQTLRVFPELLAQLQVMMARYRTGDGTGTATVTPATSCVQDSSQALYITIQEIRRQFNQLPDIDTWIQSHADSPQLNRMHRLGALARDLEDRLVPYGVVRSDWKQNAEALAGINNRGGFTHRSSLLDALLSWRSMLPRRAQDELAQIFLRYDAQLWLLRTNQVGGWDPTILPLAPTTVLQQVPLISMPLQRLGAAIGTPLRVHGWRVVVAILLGYGALVLPLGFKARIFRLHLQPMPVWQILIRLLWVGLATLMQEVVFRVALLPHPLEGATPLALWSWGIASVVAFSLYTVVSQVFFGHRRNVLQILLVMLLGVACTLAYGFTGSLLGVWSLHGIVACFWQFGLADATKPSAVEPQDNALIVR